MTKKTDPIDITHLGRRVTIPAGDRHLVRIGLDLLDKAIKTAAKSFAVLGLALDPIQTLEAQSEAVRQLHDGSEVDEAIHLPGYLCRTLRLGVAIELDRVASLREAQRDLLVPAQDTETRLQQLDGLLVLLDEQLSFTTATVEFK